MHPIDHLDALLQRNDVSHNAVEDIIECAMTSRIGRVELAGMIWKLGLGTGVEQTIHRMIRAALSKFGESSDNDSFWRPRGDEDHMESLLIPTSSSAAIVGGPIDRFEETVRERLRQAGLPIHFSDVVAAATEELISNAIEHAQSPVCPIAAYDITDGGWRFCVTDVGRGIRASLADNPSFAELDNDVAAVQEALKPGVSRTRIPGRGYGFSNVFKALVDREATVRIRTASVSVNWIGRGLAHQRLHFLTLGQRSGLHMEIGVRI